MIYKGDTPVKCYKSLGDVTVKNYDGTQTLETIPWYSEQRAYKGDSESVFETINLIYPCFDITKKHAGDVSAYNAVPANNMEALNLYYSAETANAVPSSINLFHNNTNYKYGFFKQGSASPEIGEYVQIFDEGASNYYNMAMLNFKSTTGSNHSGTNVVNNIYQCVDFGGISDITILNSTAISEDKDTINVFYQATFLTNIDVTQIDLDILVAGSPFDSEVPKTGASAIGAWTNTTYGSTFVETQPIVTFDNLKLWTISAGSNFPLADDADWTHIAPKFVFHNPSANYHIMMTNLFVSVYMSKQGV